MMRSRRNGLTLVEVLIALVVLGVGVAAAAQMQAASLRFSRQAEQIKTATQIAEAEVEWRRQTELELGDDLDCASYRPDGYDCVVDVEPCNAVGTELTLTCAYGLVSPVAYRITVDVAPPNGNAFSLSTITTGTYVTGVVGTGETAEPPTPPAEPEPDPTDPPVEPPAKPCVKWHPNKEGVCQKYGD